jgi:HEPN domain-containing protein/predicted nucleotidyltransferase
MASTAISQISDEWRDLIIRSLEPFSPLKIIVFGSRARGDAAGHSDVDLLVVLDAAENGRDLEVAMLRALAGMPFAKDVVVATPELLERRGDAVGTIYRRALREGTVIYGVDERDADIWLRYAQEDLGAATLAAEGRGFAPRIACYRAQQAAEKAFKAVLVAQGIDPVVTHDLRVLRDLVSPARSMTSVDVDLGALSQWNIRGRYPGDWGEASQADAEAAVAAARSIVDAARDDVESGT